MAPSAETWPTVRVPAQAAVRLLDGGAQAYPAMLAAIRGARADVFLEVYAFSPDGIGAEFIAALSAAARRGVRVQVVVDAWGSAPATSEVEATLAAAGCDVEVWGSNLEALAEVQHRQVAAEGERWIRARFEEGERVNLASVGASGLERLVVERIGPLVARVADGLGRFTRRRR